MKKFLLLVSMAPVPSFLLGLLKLAGVQGRLLLVIVPLLFVATFVCALLQPKWMKTRVFTILLAGCWVWGIYAVISFVWRVYC